MDEFSRGETFECEIHGLSHEGDGVGRHQGMAVFVPGAIPGDKVLCAVAEKKKNYIRGELIRLERPSPDRVNSPCSVFDRCGGCQIQNMAYPVQLEWKRRLVVDALTRIGHVHNPDVAPTIGAENPWHYRNKAQFPVGVKDGKLIAGCYKKRSHEIVHANECLIQHPTNNLILKESLDLAQRFKLPPYDETSGKGFIRYIMSRVAVGTGEAMAVIVTARHRFDAGREFAKALMARVPGLTTVIQNVNPDPTNIVLGEENRILAGSGYITDLFGNDDLGRLKFRISPLSFYQVNPAQAAVLYEKAMEMSGLKDDGNVEALDLYCGIGTITLFLAKRAALSIGIEEVPDAIADARLNARLNGIRNARFIQGKAEWVLPRLLGEGARPEVVVMDPPRAGCEKPVLDAIIKMKTQRLVYVSCYPPTLARDLEYLLSTGTFELQTVQPVDMFPHTSHVECVALMSHVKNK